MLTCKSNWFLIYLKCSLLKDDLSHNKDVSEYHTYSRTGYGAENVGSNNLDETGWWGVDLGGVYIYSVSIMFKNYICMDTFITNIQFNHVFKRVKGFVVRGENVQNGTITSL